MKILFDFAPIILFFIAYKMSDIYTATGILIVTTCITTGWSWFKHRKLERMQLITLALVVLLGGATLMLKDPLFLKWKPTVANWLFAAGFLGSQFFAGGKSVIERMMGDNIDMPSAAWTKLNMAWVIFFFAMGVLNLYVAYNFTEAQWVDFKLFGMLGLTFAFVIGQAFFLSRHMKPETEE